MSSETHSHLMTLAPAEIKDIFGCVGWQQQQQQSRSQRKDGTAKKKRNRKENQNIVNESHVVVEQQQQLENYGKQPTLRCGFSFSTRPKFDSILFYFFLLFFSIFNLGQI